jgi:hypothetical protein
MLFFKENMSLEKFTQDEIGDEIGFIMGNCVYNQYYKDPKSKEHKKYMRHVKWFIDYFDEAYQLIKSNLNVKFIPFSNCFILGHSIKNDLIST